jgi:hypothetical protein
MTVIFHNSSEDVWRALQDALNDAGFSVRGTQTFDKAHGTFKQFVSENAVGYDLVLHCQEAGRSPSARTVRSMGGAALSEFVRTHVAGDPARYRVHYLHVARSDEWDYRKLHAEWLAETLAANGSAIGFEEFRRLAEPAVADLVLSVPESRLF